MAQSRDAVRELNSQFFHLLYSVIFQHELDGTLETGAFEESFFTQGLLTKVRYRSTTRQGSVNTEEPLPSPGLKRGEGAGAKLRRSLVALSPREKSAQGLSQRGHQENTFTSCQSLLVGRPKRKPRSESQGTGRIEDAKSQQVRNLHIP